MGLYLNPWAEAFLEAVNPKIYVDKTGPLQTSNNETKEIVHNGRSLCDNLLPVLCWLDVVKCYKIM